MARRDRQWLLAAVAFTLVVRLGLAATVLMVRQDSTAFQTVDSGQYLELGGALARGEGFGRAGAPELFRLPGYPLLVAVAAWMGEPTTVTVVIQAALGAVTTWLCFLCGRAIAGTRAGLTAAWLYAVEPGQWAWSTMVLSETLFTALIATALFLAMTYLRTGRRSTLLWAATAAAGCAYVRIVGYILPAIVLGGCAVLRSRVTEGSRRTVWRDAAAGAALAALLLGGWHVRNGLRAGYWGFSTQFEGAIYFIGGGTVEARHRGSYSEAVAVLRRDVEQQGARDPSGVANDMRRVGLERIARDPAAVLATYAGGIAATMLHPGTGAIMRLLQPSAPYTGSSVTQMMTLGRWDTAWNLVQQKPPGYWLLTVPLFAAGTVYLGLFVAGSWAGRSAPLIILPCAMTLYLLLCSGGPDGDSRRRAPLVPLMCVVAGPRLAARRWVAGKA